MQLRKEHLEQALGILATMGKLFLPTGQEGAEQFLPYKPGQAYEGELINTALPPKQLLFPQTQALYHFTLGKNPQLTEVSEAEQQICFGIRPCDAEAIARLDQVFLAPPYPDTAYQRRRSRLLLIAVGCIKARPSCFCQSMGLMPDNTMAADLLLIPSSSGWNIRCHSPGGEAALHRLAVLITEGEDAALAPAKPLLQPGLAELGDQLTALFEHPLWQQFYLPCLACGACTFLCPSCYCFELSPKLRGNGGSEMCHWDSCMFAEYSRQAGGHNPRPNIKERLQNRYQHKLSHFRRQHGQNLCVGCGRCIDKCPAGLDISSLAALCKEVEP